MKVKQTLLLGLMTFACAATLVSPAAVAKGNGGGASQLTADEGKALQFMREEEKLARDVYTTLGNQWKLPVFSNIANAEQQHTDRIKSLLTTYRLADPVVNDAVGVFKEPALNTLYTQLIARGQTSLAEALQVGALVEETDISDLQKAISGTRQADIAQVYGNLMRGSRNHLRAFAKQIENQGVTYQAQALPQVEVDAIINSPTERGGQGGGQGHGNGGGNGQCQGRRMQ